MGQSTMTKRMSRSALPPGCRDQAALLRSLVRDLHRVRIQNGGSVALSYPEFVRYFRQAGHFTKHHLIIGASFSYAWMPTILDFRSSRLDDGVAVLEKARAGAVLDSADVLTLAEIVNNSVVGASKLLHFVSPERFAIWDSRVARYLGSRVTGGPSGVERYQGYNECSVAIAATEKATAIAQRITKLSGCEIKTLRAIELVMFNADVDGHTYAK